MRITEMGTDIEAEFGYVHFDQGILEIVRNDGVAGSSPACGTRRIKTLAKQAG